MAQTKERPSTAYKFEKKKVGSVEIADPSNLIQALADIKSRSYTNQLGEMEQRQNDQAFQKVLQQNVADSKLSAMIG